MRRKRYYYERNMYFCEKVETLRENVRRTNKVMKNRGVQLQKRENETSD